MECNWGKKKKKKRHRGVENSLKNMISYLFCLQNDLFMLPISGLCRVLFLNMPACASILTFTRQDFLASLDLGKRWGLIFLNVHELIWTIWLMNIFNIQSTDLIFHPTSQVNVLMLGFCKKTGKKNRKLFFSSCTHCSHVTFYNDKHIK